MKEDQNKPRDSEIPDEEPAFEESSIFDKVRPENVKRGLESFLREGRFKNLMGELKIPGEIASHIISQVDETKHAALGVISKEVRLFLERTNLSDEMAKLLTQISFEVAVQVRFVPSDKAIKTDEKKKKWFKVTKKVSRSETTAEDPGDEDTPDPEVSDPPEDTEEPR